LRPTYYQVLFSFVPAMSRFFLSLLVVVLACYVSTAIASDAPVPEGFSLPNIFNPVLDRADGRSQAKDLVNLVAKEPKVPMVLEMKVKRKLKILGMEKKMLNHLLLLHKRK